MAFPQCLSGERVLIRRPGEYIDVRLADGTTQRQIDGFEGVVTQVDGDWVYVQVADPNGVFRGEWINTKLHAEIAVLNG